MELKNVLAVCLISFFSASLVVLIARSLDSQAAARLQPQLEKIAQELEAIRQQGGLAVSPGTVTAQPVADDALMVYFFHGVRCPSCRAAEATAHRTLQTHFASELERGEIVWKVLDFKRDAEGKALADRFDVAASTIVLVKMKDGELQLQTEKRLDKVLALAEEAEPLSAYLQEEIRSMLQPEEQTQNETGPSAVVPAIPIPETAPAASGSTAGDEPGELPLPTGPAAIPIPE